MEVDPDVAVDIARSVGNDAVELHEQLTGLQRDWDNLSPRWSGAAAAAYSPLWADWLEGATTLVESLEELSGKVAAAAVRYAEQDQSAAVPIDSAALDMGI